MSLSTDVSRSHWFVKELRVTFQYSAECPSHDKALARLRKVLSEENVLAKIEVVRVENEQHAQRLEFTGSPTVLVDDQDIDPPSTLHYGINCRAYRLEDGRISPLPSEDMIRRAVRKAKRLKDVRL
jgi:uncharacterized membrane protein YukC